MLNKKKKHDDRLYQVRISSVTHKKIKVFAYEKGFVLSKLVDNILVKYMENFHEVDKKNSLDI